MKTLGLVKRLLFVAVLVASSVPMLFSASRNMTFVNGFDRNSLSIRWIGIGSNVSQAVMSAIDGLEEDLENEIIARCSKIAGKYSGNDIRSFVDGISSNVDSIKREMIRKSRCVESYETEYGESVVRYSIDAGAFESVFDKYIAKFNDDSDAMRVYTQRIQSVNRFFRNKFDFMEEVQVRVKQ